MKTTPVFVWDQRYSVGIDRFDEHHKHLIDLINRLVKAGYPDGDSQLLHEILGQMTDFFLEHIKEEELYLRNNQFSDYTNHKRQHDKFIAQTARFCTQALNRKKGLGQEVYQFLKEWFLKHILIEDMKFVEELSKKPVKLRKV